MHKTWLAVFLVLCVLASTARGACTAVAFEPRIEHPITTGGPFVGSTLDVNLDGRDDVTIFYNDDTALQTFLSNPDATLTPGVQYQTTATISEIEAGDIDGDGLPDVAYGDAFDLRLRKGFGNATYSLQQTFALSAAPTGIEIADLNGDGLSEVIVAHEITGNMVVLRQTAPWTFTVGPQFPVAGGIRDPEVVDLDGDGNLDVVLAAVSQSLSILYGRGDGTFDPVQALAVPPGASSENVSVADFNADGRLDLAIGFGGFGVTVMIHDGARAFHSAGNVGGNAGARSVEAADLNADGRTDLAISTFGGFLTVLGNGDGTFATPVFWQIDELGTGLNATDSFHFTVGDFRGDGRTDLFAKSHFAFSSFVMATYPNACAPPPAITSVTPDFGPESGGTTVTIEGTSLLSTTQVLFGTTPATIVSITATAVTVQTPPSPPDFVNVTVTTSGGSATLPDGYRYVGPSATTVTAETEPIVVGTPFTLVATVAPARTGGTVTFSEGASILGTAPVVDGRAVLQVTFTSTAARTFDAQFSGTPILEPSQGSATFRAYLPVAMALTITPPFIQLDSVYRVTAQLTPPVNGGTVAFSVDGNPAGTANVVNGVAFIDLQAASAGAHTITAAFSGFGDYAPASVTANAHIAAQVPTLSEIALLSLMLAMTALGMFRARS